MASEWALTPQQSIALECSRRGRDAVVEGCIRLIHERPVDVPLVQALGGPMADLILDYEPGDEKRYWLRVWGARGLLWTWDTAAIAAIGHGLTDRHWRVREMSAKVVARHAVGELFTQVTALRTDENGRVRAAATRALTILTAKGA
jgi:hypothetical protein